MIQVTHLSKKYGPVPALEDISFQVEKGEILGILGPNGAGKTTTLNILSGFLSPDSGQALVCGIDVTEDPVKAARHIGYLPENPPLYEEMRVRNFLLFAAEIKGVRINDRYVRVEEVMRSTGLTEKSTALIRTLSKGYRQRVGLAAAIVHDPAVLILDEPTIGLDPNQIVEIRNLIRLLATARAVIFSTHILSEAESLCARVAILHGKKIAALDTVTNLHRQIHSSSRLRLQTEGNNARIAEDLRTLVRPGTFLKKDEDNGKTQWILEGVFSAETRRDIFQKAVSGGWTILEMKNENAGLEDVFRTLTAEE